MTTDDQTVSGLRPIPYMGVIHVLAEAMKLGFRLGDDTWSNLGQGQPEVGDMPGAPERIRTIAIDPQDQAYGPISGTDEARAAVADHYNRLFRRNASSRYGPENVTIACGGRLALTRIFAALGEGCLGYKVPDYTAYEDQINYHKHRCRPLLLEAAEETGFNVTSATLEQAVTEHGLTAFVVSNPCNPTGMVVKNGELAAWLDVARRRSLTLVLDEFYSHFIYEPDGPGQGPVSGAAHVQDVDTDPVLLVDGLTKSFRYPGWRVGWVVGPEPMIEILGRAASALDGGPSRPLQRALIQALEPARADQETCALRTVFAAKRDLMVRRLKEMGIRLPRGTDSTFYTWACLEDLPQSLADGERFFRAALERRVITVPGRFFDVNPDGRDPERSPFRTWMRFSFGPQMQNLEQGLDRLSEMVAEHS